MKRDRKKVFKGNLEQLTEGIVPHAIHETWLHGPPRVPAKESSVELNLEHRKIFLWKEGMY